MADGLDPDEMQDYIDRVKNQFQQEENQIQQDQQEAENLEKDAESHEEKAGKEAKEAAAETQDAEEKGDSNELEDAEREEQDAEDEAGEAEEEIDAAEQDIEEEISLEEKQEKLVEDAEQKAEEILTEARSELQKEMSRLKKIQNSDEAQLDEKDYQRVEDVLMRYRDGIKIINTTTGMISELQSEILETEKEEQYSEKISAELTQVFGLEEREVAELERMYQKLGDQRHEKKAQDEARQLEAEEQHEQEEEQEQQKVDSELFNETRELEQIVKENEDLLGLVDQSINDLRELYQLLNSEQQRNIWRFSGSEPPIDDIERTINVMQSGLGTDEDAIQEEESRMDQIKANAKNLGTAGAKAAGNRFASAATSAPAIAIFGILIVIIVYTTVDFSGTIS